MHRFLNILAKVIRIVTVPPLLALCLLTVLHIYRSSIFGQSIVQYLMTAVFLVIIPILSYLVSFTVPQFRKKGREFQRDLAFISNLAGYAAGAVYGFAAGVSKDLMLIFLTYLFSVLILTLLNKVFKIRASGHACAVLGPLIIIVHFLGFYYIIPSIVIFATVMWSSLRLKRHTIGDILFGYASTAAAFCVSLLIYVL